MKTYPRYYFTKIVPKFISIKNIPELQDILAFRIRVMLRDLENINNPMKRFRAENELTCQDVADKMGTYAQRYNDIELGQLKPHPDEQEFINNMFGSETLAWVMEQYNKQSEDERGDYVSTK